MPQKKTSGAFVPRFTINNRIAGALTHIERAISVLEFLIERRQGTVAQIALAFKLNRRTLQRDLKLLLEKGLAREIAANPTDPTKHYEPLL